MLLNYTDDGPGPVVVLLHGFPLDHSMWDYQRGSIGSIYRVICPDLRGHGKTAAPEGIYTIDAMADDVIETIEALEIDEPFVLGGLSMGGYVALSIAVRYPTRLRGLMLMDTRAGADTPETARVREELARDVESTGSVASVVASMLPKLFAPTTHERRPDLVARMEEVMTRTPARAVAGALRGMAVRPDRTPELPQIAIPTLVLAGSDDQLISSEESRRLAASLPQARLVLVPEAGHLAPFENPAPVDGAILEFLKTLG